MTTAGPVSESGAVHVTRRRASRQILVVPLEVEWQEPRGGAVTEPARTRDMSPNGALLLMKNCPRSGTPVTLKNLLTGEFVTARATELRRSAEGRLMGMVVELTEPSETFWGLTFQLQRATEQLLTIEKSFQALKSGVDFRVLRSLREIVEDLRQIAAAVQQWQELQVEGKDAYRVLDVVTSARVARGTNLLRELTADIDAACISSDSEEFTNFSSAVERLYERLTRGPVSFRNAE